MDNSNFLGLNGFVWWIGVVENRKDPLKMGRCQIRVFGWHTEDLNKIPTADLPWAQAILPPNNSKEWKSPYEGDWVIGFFLDNRSGQVPIYFGVLPSIPVESPMSGKGFYDQGDMSDRPVSNDFPPGPYPSRLDEPVTSRLYRNEMLEETIIARQKEAIVSGVNSAGVSWSQPEPSYAAVPPYNQVRETESGHVMEFDDTKGAERVHVSHRTGTFLEIRPDGTQVTRVINDNYEVISGNDFVYVKGNCNVTVDGNVNMSVGGNVTAEVAGNADVTVGGNTNLTVGGNMTTRVGGSYDITSGGPFTVRAPRINLN